MHVVFAESPNDWGSIASIGGNDQLLPLNPTHKHISTQEMTAHTPLVMHNIATVMQAFFVGVRETITASTLLDSSNALTASVTRSRFDTEILTLPPPIVFTKQGQKNGQR